MEFTTEDLLEQITGIGIGFRGAVLISGLTRFDDLEDFLINCHCAFSFVS